MVHWLSIMIPCSWNVTAGNFGRRKACLIESENRLVAFYKLILLFTGPEELEICSDILSVLAEGMILGHLIQIKIILWHMNVKLSLNWQAFVLRRNKLIALFDYPSYEVDKCSILKQKVVLCSHQMLLLLILLGGRCFRFLFREYSKHFHHPQMGIEQMWIENL